ncbi:hypothetical protein [Azospirillum sp. B4]|uniref:hypothetical protein n=1 Tax=Azospirillum sp. B4 TaxID=95605 RepID=UPI0005CA01E4|nr:hypothetical protein [Azospirillum sp. B4]
MAALTDDFIKVVPHAPEFSRAEGAGSIAIGSESAAFASDGRAIAIGDKAVANGDHSIAIGWMATSVTSTHTGTPALDAVTIGFHAGAYAPSAVALGSGSQASTPFTVSVGGDASIYGPFRRRIVYVADGTDVSDAATVGQLRRTKAELEEQLSALREDYSKLAALLQETAR